MAAVAAPDRMELNINDDAGPAPLISQPQPAGTVRQSFITTLCTVFCPYATAYSVIFAIAMVNIVVFIITVGLAKGDSNKFACVLYKAGAIDSYDLKYNYEIHRLFAHMFLHASKEHIMGNMAMLCLFGFEVEKQIGHT